MKNIILRLLWLEDSQIKTKGRRYARIDIMLGIFLILLAALHAAGISMIGAAISRQAELCINNLLSSPGLITNTAAILPAVEMLGRIPSWMNLLGWPIAVLVALMGLCSLKMGTLYLKAYAAMNDVSKS